MGWVESQERQEIESWEEGVEGWKGEKTGDSQVRGWVGAKAPQLWALHEKTRAMG